ncbi:hypothetical protein [Flexibacterium corallicola]|uniref:hypothetical protein n=1 Tax=Flexibacterium corallicola TaxID=3037259 RepID=UPI00286F10A7|nr:hypothetical protein [Pseudovibrio sp. M1P-2-3]
MIDDQITRLSSLIGKPYSKTNTAPGLHCWGLFCEAQEILGQKGLPAICELAEGPIARAKAFRSHEEYSRWIEVGAPAHGCAVMMAKRPDLYQHIGVYLSFNSGGVLHAHEPAVQFETFSSLRFAGWKLFRFLIKSQ